MVWVYNLGDSVDSIGHLFGERPFGDQNAARNGGLLGLISLGEGYHANHHAFPSSARLDLLPGQLDGVWIMVRGLELIGLASEPHFPMPAAILERRQLSLGQGAKTQSKETK